MTENIVIGHFKRWEFGKHNGLCIHCYSALAFKNFECYNFSCGQEHFQIQKKNMKKTFNPKINMLQINLLYLATQMSDHCI